MSGKKTYLSAAAMAMFAFGGWYLGRLDASETLHYLTEAAAIVALRLGIAKLQLGRR